MANTHIYRQSVKTEVPTECSEIGNGESLKVDGHVQISLKFDKKISVIVTFSLVAVNELRTKVN